MDHKGEDPKPVKPARSFAIKSTSKSHRPPPSRSDSSIAVKQGERQGAIKNKGEEDRHNPLESDSIASSSTNQRKRTSSELSDDSIIEINDTNSDYKSSYKSQMLDGDENRNKIKMKIVKGKEKINALDKKNKKNKTETKSDPFKPEINQLITGESQKTLNDNLIESNASNERNNLQVQKPDTNSVVQNKIFEDQDLLEKCKYENCNLKFKVEYLEKENQDLNKQKEELQHNRIVKEMEIEELNYTNKYLRDELEKAAKSYDEYSEKINQIESAKCKLEDENKRLIASNIKLTQKNTSLKSEVLFHQKSNADLYAQHKADKENWAKDEALFKKNQNELLKQALLEANSKRTTFERVLLNKEKQNQKLVELMNEENEKLLAQNQELEKKLNITATFREDFLISKEKFLKAHSSMTTTLFEDQFKEFFQSFTTNPPALSNDKVEDSNVISINEENCRSNPP